MSAADRRIAELLDRWLTSLDLHANYLDLDNEAYGRAQAWPPHQRPTRWIIDLAKTRTLDLKRMLGERQGHGDADFAEALELMSFLTTLLGSEHVERFIPLAIQSKSGTVAQRMTAPAPRPAATPAPATTAASAPASRQPQRPPSKSDSREATNRVPAPAVSAKTQANVDEGSASTNRTRVIPAARSTRVRTTSRSQTGGNQRPSSARAPNAGRANDNATSARAARAAPAAEPRISDRVVKQVIADAVRILDWGSEWPQLAGLIARLADRPTEKDVWRILREHRATIESQAKARAG